MFGQEVFGQLLLITLLLIIWTIYSTNRIVTYCISMEIKQQGLLFYQWLTFLIVTGLIFLFFKIYKIKFFLPLYFSSSFLTGIYFYLALKRHYANWLTKLNTNSVGLKIAIPVITVILTAGLFALIILGLFRLT